MAVTEFALLKIKSAVTSTSNANSTEPIPAALLKNLHHAATSQAQFSKYPVTLLRCIEAHDQIYLVGAWESVQTHMEDWIPGPKNQELLGLLGPDVDVNWMFHVVGRNENVDGVAEFRSVVEKVRDGAVGGESGTSDSTQNGVIAIGRHFIKGGKEGRNEFLKTWEANKDALEMYVKGGKRNAFAGGWRVDGGFEAAANGKDEVPKKEPNEFVLLTAWNAVQEHIDFGNTEEFKRYGKIRDHLEGAEIRHAEVLFTAEP